MTVSVTAQPKRNIIQAVSNYSKRLFHFIRQRVNSDEDAEDILQDVWFQFSNVMNTEPVEQISAWLYRVARNRIIDNYRKSSHINNDSLPLDEEDSNIDFKLISERGMPEEEYLRVLFWEQLQEALDELPEEQRQVFIWNELEDIPFEEIAERTGEKVSTLISRKRYAVLHLRKKLEQLYKEIIEP
jgi:RNA polymerase sigma factor, sigma-70 family